MQTEDITSINSNILRDCFSAELLKRTATPSSKPSKRQSTKSNKKRPSYTVSTIQEPVTELQDAEDLADFIEVYLPSLVPIQHDLIPAYTAKPKQYLSTELYSSLPLHLQTLSHETSQPNPPPVEALLPTLPPSLTESLTAYSLLPASTSAQNLLSAVLTGYIAAATAAPSIGLVGKVQAQVKGCEICKRDWIPLTGHHLIPRSVHAKVLKRGWHPEWRLGSVAWLCRACHSYVHSVESNEDLAREWFTIERLKERDDVRRWAGWVGKVRWKAR